MPEWDDEDEIDSNLVKDLRKQLKAAKDAKAEVDKELSTLRPQVRGASLRNVLSEIGANPKIAALLPSDVEPTKEAVSDWLKEYGELFNLKAPEEGSTKEPVEEPLAGQKQTEPEPQMPGLTPEVMELWSRIQNGESANGATAPDIEKRQVAQLGQAAAASNGSFDSFVAILRGEKPLPS